VVFEIGCGGGAREHTGRMVDVEGVRKSRCSIGGRQEIGLGRGCVC